MDQFLELGVIIAIAAALAIVSKYLRQPLIVSYIVTGIIVGPFVLNIVSASDMIATFSHIGVSLLLFVVGMSLSPKVIREVGKVSLVVGLGQVVFTTIIGYGICRLLGLNPLSSLYTSVALTFSSTIIIMKLLSDKGDTEKLYAKIAIGVLLVQDLLAVVILMMISSAQKATSIPYMIATTLLGGIGALGIILVIGIYVLPKITNFIARSQELLVLFSLSWALSLAALLSYFGYAIEIGALLAGITLSFSPYRYEISSRMRPVRDFFLVLFFIMLGYQMEFGLMVENLGIIVLLSIFVLVGNPLIVLILMGWLGYTKKNSFLCGLTVAQISEFSLILVALGMKVGHIGPRVLSIVTAVGLITIAGSSYLILYGDRLYRPIARFLTVFEISGKKIDEHKYHKDGNYEIFLFGFHRIGDDMIKTMRSLKKRFLVIDYNPETVIKLARKGIPCRYGDASDMEMLDELSVKNAKMVICAISDFDTTAYLIEKIREQNKNTVIVTLSYRVEEALELYNKGASYVILPHTLGGQHMSMLIEENGLEINKFLEQKLLHLNHLKKSREQIMRETPVFH